MLGTAGCGRMSSPGGAGAAASKEEGRLPRAMGGTNIEEERRVWQDGVLHDAV